MKVSGFTIVRNAVKFHYPVIASITSILPICDEFIVNVGDSDDGTLDLVRSIKDPRVRIIETKWDMSKGSAVLSEQTNIALSHCTGDWAFYLQTDEVIHEADLPRLRSCMLRYWHDPSVDALRFKWLHFYGSFWRYRIDAGWYQKQDRIIRNNGTIESHGDAFSFQRKDRTPLRRKNTGCLLYHYGWVHSGTLMAHRLFNAVGIGYAAPGASAGESAYDYGNLDRFPIYFGTHPAVMREAVEAHALSAVDWQTIRRRHRFNPFLLARLRYKTFKRVRHKIE